MILVWIGALLVGLSLGLLGSGGSILTVPVLVYLVGEEEKTAIAESLGIVGAIALLGFLPYAFKRQVHWRSVILFGLPGMAGTYGGALIAAYVSGTFQLLLFAVVMLIAAFMMFTDKKKLVDKRPAEYRHAWWKMVIEGSAVGVLTGLVGVGGGFLIVPALVILVGLSMSLAVGTSLAIIALKSFSGFYKYLEVLQSLDLNINWELLLVFTLIGAVGSLLGKKIGSKISNQMLKKGFALFLVAMAGYIMFRNI